MRFQALNEPSLTLLGRGDRTQLSLTASGGTQALQFRLTGTYEDEVGLLQMPGFEVERFRTRFGRAAPDWMQRPHHYTTWDVSSNLTANLSPTLDVSLLTTLSRSEQQRTTLEGQVSRMVGTYVDTINGEYYEPTNTITGTGYRVRTDGFALGSTSTLLADYYTRQTASTLTLRQGANAQWRRARGSPRARRPASRSCRAMMPRCCRRALPSAVEQWGRVAGHRPLGAEQPQPARRSAQAPRPGLRVPDQCGHQRLDLQHDRLGDRRQRAGAGHQLDQRGEDR